MGALTSILKFPWRIIKCILKIEEIHKFETNHTEHHIQRVEPKINRIAEDVAFIRGKLEN